MITSSMMVVFQTWLKFNHSLMRFRGRQWQLNKGSQLKQPVGSTGHGQGWPGGTPKTKRKSMARSHLNHFNQVLQTPMPLSGANLWSKQECVIAVGIPSGPNSPFLWTWLILITLLVERVHEATFSDPPQYFMAINSVADTEQQQHQPSLRQQSHKSLAPAAWAESMLYSNGILDGDTTVSSNKHTN